ncbi:MAG TPA: TolC family protein, partial [Clostridia bacterium]|nr:TolC family protein [Clostridia bacterium]
MKKLCFILSVILCMTAMLGNISAFAGTDDDKVLTLEEAKTLALENDIQFNLQQGYIQNASESYEDVYESNSGSDNKKYSNVAERAKAEVSRKIAIENAASSVRKAVFTRNDLKRESDYTVTEAYYGVVNAKLELENAEAEKELSYKNLETAKIKYSLDLIKKSELSTAEDTYDSAVKAYDNAFTEVQKSMVELSNSIGKTLDVFNDQLDMTVSVPDIKGLDMNKIKEDYMKNNSSWY